MILVFLIQSQGPSPTPRKANETHEQKASPEKGESRPDDQMANDLTSAVNKLASVIAARNQEQSSEKSHNESPADWWSRASTILVTIFTGVLACMAYWQWRAMQAQATYIQSQAAYMRKAERAWMVTTIPGLEPFKKPWDIVYFCYITNCGKTPARILEVGVALDKATSLDKIPTRPDQKGESYNKIVVAPGDSLPVIARFEDRNERLGVSEFASFEAGENLFVYGYGFVRYLDAFSDDHVRETRFCHYYRIPSPGEPPQWKGYWPCIKAPAEYHMAT